MIEEKLENSITSSVGLDMTGICLSDRVAMKDDQTRQSRPPSTAMDSPVTNAAAGDTRYSSAPPSSSGLMSRLSGRYFIRFLENSSPAVAGLRSASSHPALMALMR